MTTVTDAIVKDHMEINEYYKNYEKARQNQNDDEQNRWANLLTWEVARHSVGEELVVYPMKLGSEGRAMAAKDLEQHQEVKNLLSKLESLKPGSEPFHETLKSIMEMLKTHIESEESSDLPKLEQALQPKESADAAKSFESTKKFVPTRAHPSAPNKPPFESLVAFMTAPIDKLRDAFKAFPTEEMKQDVAREA